MSVYTEIEDSKLAQLCSQFGIGMVSASPIEDGVQNSNWFIKTDDKEYVLTLYEAKPTEEVTKLTALVKALSNSDLPIALPLQHESGMHHTLYQGKAVQVTPRLKGIHPKETDALMCQAIGEAMASLHESLATLDATTYALQAHDWEASRDKNMAKMGFEDKKLMYKIWQSYQAAKIGGGDDVLPEGLIHADLFFDNTLWSDDKITGLLDFTEVSADDLLMDIAITANDFCTDWEELSFDNDKLDYFLEGYNSIRQLTPLEEKALPAFLAMAAARFWLFRLDMIAKNTEENRGGDLVTVKSPDLMRALAQLHFNNL